MEIDLANVLSAAGAIISAYFAYNQYTKNKMTDLKIEYFKKEEENKAFKRSENSAKVFGELWRILHELDADRVYIVQPHPLGHAAFLSIQYEVKRKGVEGMINKVQSMPMSDIANFSKTLAETLFAYYKDIDMDVTDNVAKGIMMVNGCKAAAIKRLNSSSDWVGNIFCEFTDESKPDDESVRSVLHEAALNIQYILPEYRERKFV